MLGKVSLYCPSCGDQITTGSMGAYNTRNWGYLCGKVCYDRMEMAYARMILGKDTDFGDLREAPKFKA